MNTQFRRGLEEAMKVKLRRGRSKKETQADGDEGDNTYGVATKNDNQKNVVDEHISNQRKLLVN